MAEESSRCLVVFRGLIVRLLFSLHAFFCVWQVKSIKENPYYWILMVAQLAVVIEAIFTLSLRKKGEWDWISPCITIYLLSVIPCIWLLELELLNIRSQVSTQTNMMVDVLEIDQTGASTSVFFHMNNVTCDYVVTNMTETLFGTIKLEAGVLNGWRSAMLLQSFLILIIFGRWILPRGTLRHKDLSNLLLVHIGMAADILEFISESIAIDYIRCDKNMILVILAVWSWSLFQFPFHCFSKISDDIIVSPETDGQPRKRAWLSRCLRNPDVWCSLCTCAMQDGPYLVVRLYLCTFFGFSNQSQVFFIAKNLMVLMLQFYRLWALVMAWEDSEGRVVERKFKSIRMTMNRLRPRSSRRQSDLNSVRVHGSVSPSEREHTFKTFQMADADSTNIRSSLQVPEIVLGT